MRGGALYLAAGAAALAASAVFVVAQQSNGDERRADAARIAEGRALYTQYCAACHGAELEGQPDWRTPGEDGRLPAPPHDASGHTWHHSDSLLFDYTKFGGAAVLARQGVTFDSGMPGFGDQLSDRQIENILDYIRSTWPDRIRQVQAERTKSEMQKGTD